MDEWMGDDLEVREVELQMLNRTSRETQSDSNFWPWPSGSDRCRHFIFFPAFCSLCVCLCVCASARACCLMICFARVDEQKYG